MSVIVPVYNENPETFFRCLSSLPANYREKLIVSINGQWPERERIEEIAKTFTKTIVLADFADKRLAIARAVKSSSADIIILIDSDTFLAADAVREMLKPFQDPKVGRVTSRQRIENPLSSILASVADWMESIRYKINQRAQSSFGAVGCLPGRMIAIRRKILVGSIPTFVNQVTLGVRCR